VLAGPVFGQGSLIGSADPAKGNNAWFLGSSPELMFYEMAKFNGWLYLGTISASGYSIVKTRAEGTPPYQFVTVVPPGAFLRDRPSRSVVSMHETKGRLHVGTATQTELIRINPDDTWDLVVGPPRQAVLPNGQSEWKYPLSGLDAGFGHTLNDHAWQMDDAYQYHYVGTYNASIASKEDPVNGPLLRHNMGAHMYRTADDWYFSAVTTDGFSIFGDPLGGRFDYGIRTMEKTPYGVFVGTANDYYGLSIFRSTSRGASAPDEPYRVDIEATSSGAPLLSWVESKEVKRYQIWRAEVNGILVRDDANFEGWNGTTGNKIPDTYVGPYTQIGDTRKERYIDTTVLPGKKYMYYVLQETEQNDARRRNVSDQSNLVAFPLLKPAVTFASLLQEVDRLAQRQRFETPDKGPAKVREQIIDARTKAAKCKLNKAIEALDPDAIIKHVLDPEATDVAIQLARLARRLTLYQDIPNKVVSTEFCTEPE
jgi:hypothetical protein